MSAALLLATAVAGHGAAETKAPYSWDFSKEIDTGDPAFKVGSNWGHIVGSYDDWGTLHYMQYSYETTSGVNGTSCLKADRQYSVSDYSWDSNGDVTDILVTPLVKGDVKMKVKKVYSYAASPYIEVYEINADGSAGAKITEYKGSNIGDSDYEWYELDLATGLTDYKRLGLRCQLIYIDDFTATAADIVKEPGLKFASVTPSASSGRVYWDQQSNGKVKIDFKVTVTNTGELFLAKGMENYSISVLQKASGGDTELFTVAVPQNLAVGATSDEFSVTGEIDPSCWTSSYSGITLALRENLSGATYSSATSYYNAYEPRFVFRENGSQSTSSLSGTASFGFVSEPTSLTYEIYNDGTAPMTVRKVTVSDGFFSDAPAQEFTVAPKGVRPVTLTLGTDRKGMVEGTLSIVWLGADGSERNYTLGLQGNVIDADTWTCDFGTGTGAYPEGSIVSGEISLGNTDSDYNLVGGSYGEAEFITPLLHAEAGESLSFSAGSYSYSSWNPAKIQVYFSKDRFDWGEPVVSLQNELSSQWRTFTAAAPEAGDWYVKFSIPNAKLDNLCGFTEVERSHDLYFKSVTCPESVRSGEEVTYRVTVMAPLAAAAADYTVSLMDGDKKVADIPSVDFPADASASSDWSAVFTPEVEKTVTMRLYVKAAFADGTEIRSAVRELRVENQPDFVLFDAGTEVYDDKPASRTAAIDFGRINTPGAAVQLEIFNWGSAPLEVTSVTLPDGFSSNIAKATVAPGQRQPLTVTVTAATPGSYLGELVVTYKDVDDADVRFSLPVSATMLDPSKWHLAFTGEGDITWPAGTIHGLSVNGNKDYSDATWYVSSSATSDNVFITPMLRAEAGETIEITARTGSYYDSSTLNVYAAPTREALVASASAEPELAATRRLLATIGPDAEDENFKADANWKTFRVAMDEAGDFYIGLELLDGIRVSELYGYTPVANDHELVLKGFSIPANAMQNVASPMSVSVHNYAFKAETPETYTLTAIVNGEEMAVTPVKDIPVNTAFHDAATVVPVAVRYHTPGTFPVQLRLDVEGQSLVTETRDVVFAKEEASGLKQVGEVADIEGNSAPVRFNDKNSETVMLFTAEELGLNAGDRISAITFRGYSNETTKQLEFKLKAYYEWTDDQTEDSPANGMYDVSAMTQILNDETPREWAGVQGSKENPVDLITITLDTPLEYETGKSLRIVMSHNEANEYFSNFGFEQTAKYSNAYYHSSDYESGFSTGWWSSGRLPVMYLTLVAEPATVSGTVTDGGEPVQGAVVTCVSTDGDNVRYTAETDATGRYSMDVIQNLRTYDVTVVAGGREDFAEGMTFDASRDDLDFSLADVVTIASDAATAPTAMSGAIVKFDLPLEPGCHGLVLPFGLTAEEVNAIFGEGTEVSALKESSLNGSTLHISFALAQAQGGMLMQAGKPYIVNVREATSPMRLRGKDIVADIDFDSDTNIDFDGTYVTLPVEQGMFLIEEGTFVPTRPEARSAATVAPFSAFVRVSDPAVTSITYSTGGVTGIDDIEAADIDEDSVIYNLQGIRVHNPQPGIYIVNGRKTLIK